MGLNKMSPFEPFSAVAVETIYVACNSYILVGGGLAGLSVGKGGVGYY